MISRNTKFIHGYAKNSAMSYHEIGHFMTAHGYKMSHSLVHYVFGNAMQKIANSICEAIGDDKTIDPKLCAKDPRFQSAIETYLKEIKEEDEKNGNLGKIL